MLLSICQRRFGGRFDKHLNAQEASNFQEVLMFSLFLEGFFCIVTPLPQYQICLNVLDSHLPFFLSRF